MLSVQTAEGFKMFATFEEISNRSYQSLVSTVGAREANGSSRSDKNVELLEREVFYRSQR